MGLKRLEKSRQNWEKSQQFIQKENPPRKKHKQQRKIWIIIDFLICISNPTSTSHNLCVTTQMAPFFRLFVFPHFFLLFFRRTIFSLSACPKPWSNQTYILQVIKLTHTTSQFPLECSIPRPSVFLKPLAFFSFSKPQLTQPSHISLFTSL